MLVKGIVVSAVVMMMILFVYRQHLKKKRKLAAYKLPKGAGFLLYCYVPMYRSLNVDERKQFEERMRDFLSRTKVTGVQGVRVEDIDLILVAASAVIPLWGHTRWRYNQLNEVLLYGGNFSRQYDTEGPGRDVLGMVGDGVMHRHMILSQPALRAGFLYPDNVHNTAIHEFVHLIDKADGATDGVPNYLLDKLDRKRWKEIMYWYMNAISQGYTDIDPYGATKESEFFAVVSEYYFKQPELMNAQHPELYALLHKMYRPANAA